MSEEVVALCAQITRGKVEQRPVHQPLPSLNLSKAMHSLPAVACCNSICIGFPRNKGDCVLKTRSLRVVPTSTPITQPHPPYYFFRSPAYRSRRSLSQAWRDKVEEEIPRD
ncbi:hypothetical protein BaRGS_00006466 [Batillaria attramentaria]|uniref:Uncharacterized protein n=1 Tax=Batillaria attramentaria TaxID=370345 RepID=A0ABD0LTK2_9CAEN